ncbi:MAG: hypothetical protein AAFW70_11340 [Cyanobacteria bacterium J06635_10]
MPSLFESCEIRREMDLREQEFSLLNGNGNEYTLDELFFKSVCTNWQALFEDVLAQESLEYAEFLFNNVLDCYPFLKDHIYTVIGKILHDRKSSTLDEERKTLEVKRRLNKESLKYEINRITQRWENEVK